MSSSFKCNLLLLHIAWFANVANSLDLSDKVIAAVNCGGQEAIGAHGIQYSADTSTDGVASDHGMQFSFSNADPDDLEIYTTERWSKESFEYSVPAGDGEYVIILKFSEVYFQRSGQKIFHVRINYHLAINDLDIFEASGGRGFAYDAYIPVVVKGNTIYVQGRPRDYDGNILIEFSKGSSDNPKVNGFAVVRGKIEDMPEPPKKFIQVETTHEDFDIYDMTTKEDSSQQEVVRVDEIEEDSEMFSASNPSNSQNPFENFKKQETVEWWHWILIVAIIAIPTAFFLQQYLQQPE
ncbi:unnamed protein product [Caenorhabditis sp. 36 PRJEB53466]|nr:unnamed protein product [Caenorhabditis sp. 36 PRJEB53466]